MAKYEYTGDDERYFPELGQEVKPGDTIETDAPVKSPLLKPVGKKPADQEA